MSYIQSDLIFISDVRCDFLSVNLFRNLENLHVLTFLQCQQTLVTIYASPKAFWEL